jgi:molybdenum cofactor cytidylyltransferase
MHARVTGIILAAGRASRMGEMKQLIEIDGRPMLVHVIAAAAASTLDEILVVLGYEAARVRQAVLASRCLASNASDRVRFVENDAFEAGQSTSLTAGLRAAVDAQAAAILLGDEPDIDAAAIDRVLEAYRHADASATPIVRAVYRDADRDGAGRVPGHPVVFDQSVWWELERLTGDAGARAVIATDAGRVLCIDVEGPAPRDLDTPQDLSRRDG